MPIDLLTGALQSAVTDHGLADDSPLVRIRECRWPDLPDLAIVDHLATVHESFRSGCKIEDLPSQEWSAMQNDSEVVKLVAMKGRLPIGYVVAAPSLGVCWKIRRLGVDPEHQRQGIGARLLIELVKEQCMPSLSALVHERCLGVLAFYRAVGFRCPPRGGLYRNHFDDGDAILLRWSPRECDGKGET